MAADAKPDARPNHWRDIHKRKNVGLLYAEDLGPTGTKIDVYIDETGTVEAIGADGKKKMPFIAKQGRKKLGLNSTNCKTLETITGSPDWVDWTGWFTLVVVRVKYKDMKTGDNVETDAIRIAPQRPRRTEPPSGSKPVQQRNAPEQQDMYDEERAEIMAREAKER